MPISRLFTSCFPHLFQSRRVLAPGVAEGRRGNFISALLNRWFHRSRGSSWEIRGARRELPDVRRFLKAQTSRQMTQVLKELRSGKKMSHWMWFVFPQPPEPGASKTSKHFAIQSVDHARDFLREPKLRHNLIQCLDALLQPSNADRSAEDIFGDIDAKKLHACMTLFRRVAGDVELRKKLDQVQQRFFNGGAHSWTERCVDNWYRARLGTPCR